MPPIPRVRSLRFAFCLATTAAALGQAPAVAADKFSRPEIPLPPARSADYVGIYQINARVRFTIIKDGGGRLQGRLTGQRFLALIHAGGDEFVIPSVQVDVLFGRSRSGHINTVMIFQKGVQVQGTITDDAVPTVIFVPAAQLAQYEGEYLFPDGTACKVVVVNGWLYGQVADDRAYPLTTDAKDHFIVDDGPAGIAFERNRAGVITELALERNGQVTHLPKAPLEATQKAAP